MSNSYGRRYYGSNSNVSSKLQETLHTLCSDIDSVKDRLIRTDKSIKEVLAIVKSNEDLLEELLDVARINSRGKHTSTRGDSDTRQDKVLQGSSTVDEKAGVYPPGINTQLTGLDKVLSEGSEDDDKSSRAYCTDSSCDCSQEDCSGYKFKYKKNRFPSPTK